MAEQSQPGLRVATWNVHSCIGRNRTFAPHLTVAIAKMIGADILALQEVDSRPHVSAGLDTFEFLRRKLGGHAVRATTIEEAEGACYGHMLVSRWPIRRSQVHDASVPGAEPRKVIEAEVDTPAGSWGVAAVHFGLNRRERRIQLHFIRDMLDRVTYEPVLVLGDFNVPTRGGLSKRLLADVHGVGRAPATFPSCLPLLPLDRIWCRPAHLIRQQWVVRSARSASDHLPLVAEVSITGAGLRGLSSVPMPHTSASRLPQRSFRTHTE